MRKITPLKVAVVQSGRSQRSVAAALGFDETHFSRIVNGLHVDDATQRAIADELGRTVQELFPDHSAAA